MSAPTPAPEVSLEEMVAAIERAKGNVRGDVNDCLRQRAMLHAVIDYIRNRNDNG